jgi:hypothetical protein
MSGGAGIPTLAVLTACKPDSILALNVLAAREAAGDVKVAFFVAGEGAATIRACSLVATTRQMGAEYGVWRAVQVLPGVNSDDFMEDEAGKLDPSYGFAARAFAEKLKDAHVTTLLCMKPPREIEALVRSDPKYASEVLGSIDLVLYGSFNLRAMATADGSNFSNVLLSPSATPFKSVTWYEHFTGMAAPQECVVSEDTLPGFFAYMDATPAFTCFLSAARAWDQAVIKDCDATCAEVEAAKDAGDPIAIERWNRNNNCRIKVAQAVGRQVVPADFVLCSVWNNPDFDCYLKPVSSFVLDGARSQYPVVHHADATVTTKVRQYVGLDWNGVKRALFALLGYPGP